MGCDHINALYKFTITYLLIDESTDGQTDRQTDRHRTRAAAITYSQWRYHGERSYGKTGRAEVSAKGTRMDGAVCADRVGLGGVSPPSRLGGLCSPPGSGAEPHPLANFMHLICFYVDSKA